jgi:hypothetical protein
MTQRHARDAAVRRRELLKQRNAARLGGGNLSAQLRFDSPRGGGTRIGSLHTVSLNVHSRKNYGPQTSSFAASAASSCSNAATRVTASACVHNTPCVNNV